MINCRRFKLDIGDDLILMLSFWRNSFPIQTIHDTLGVRVATVLPNDTWGREGVNQNFM